MSGLGRLRQIRVRSYFEINQRFGWCPFNKQPICNLNTTFWWMSTNAVIPWLKSVWHWRDTEQLDVSSNNIWWTALPTSFLNQRYLKTECSRHQLDLDIDLKPMSRPWQKYYRVCVWIYTDLVMPNLLGWRYTQAYMRAHARAYFGQWYVLRAISLHSVPIHWSQITFLLGFKLTLQTNFQVHIHTMQTWKNA